MGGVPGGLRRRRRGSDDDEGRLRSHEARSVYPEGLRLRQLWYGRPGRRQSTVLRPKDLFLRSHHPTRKSSVPHRSHWLSGRQVHLS